MLYTTVMAEFAIPVIYGTARDLYFRLKASFLRKGHGYIPRPELNDGKCYPTQPNVSRIQRVQFQWPDASWADCMFFIDPTVERSKDAVPAKKSKATQNESKFPLKPKPAFVKRVTAPRRVPRIGCVSQLNRDPQGFPKPASLSHFPKIGSNQLAAEAQPSLFARATQKLNGSFLTSRSTTASTPTAQVSNEATPTGRYESTNFYGVTSPKDGTFQSQRPPNRETSAQQSSLYGFQSRNTNVSTNSTGPLPASSLTLGASGINRTANEAHFKPAETATLDSFFSQGISHTGVRPSSTADSGQSGLGFAQRTATGQSGLGFAQTALPAPGQSGLGFAQRTAPGQSGLGFAQPAVPAPGQSGLGFAQRTAPGQSGLGFAQPTSPAKSVPTVKPSLASTFGNASGSQSNGCPSGPFGGQQSSGLYGAAPPYGAPLQGPTTQRTTHEADLQRTTTEINSHQAPFAVSSASTTGLAGSSATSSTKPFGPASQVSAVPVQKKSSQRNSASGLFATSYTPATAPKSATVASSTPERSNLSNAATKPGASTGIFSRNAPPSGSTATDVGPRPTTVCEPFSGSITPSATPLKPSSAAPSSQASGLLNDRQSSAFAGQTTASAVEPKFFGGVFDKNSQRPTTIGASSNGGENSTGTGRSNGGTVTAANVFGTGCQVPVASGNSVDTKASSKVFGTSTQSKIPFGQTKNVVEPPRVVGCSSSKPGQSAVSSTDIFNGTRTSTASQTAANSNPCPKVTGMFSGVFGNSNSSGPSNGTNAPKPNEACGNDTQHSTTRPEKARKAHRHAKPHRASSGAAATSSRPAEEAAPPSSSAGNLGGGVKPPASSGSSTGVSQPTSSFGSVKPSKDPVAVNNAAKPSGSSGLFGGANPSTSGLFSGTAQRPAPTSTFGPPNVPRSTAPDGGAPAAPGIFGGTAKPPGTTSIFDGTAGSSGIFGGPSVPQNASVSGSGMFGPSAGMFGPSAGMFAGSQRTTGASKHRHKQSSGSGLFGSSAVFATSLGKAPESSAPNANESKVGALFGSRDSNNAQANGLNFEGGVDVSQATAKVVRRLVPQQVGSKQTSQFPNANSSTAATFAAFGQPVI